jgi:hypothetical protein
MKDNGVGHRRPKSGVKDCGLVLDVFIPPAEFPLRVPISVFKRLYHEFIVIGRHVDRQRKICQDSMRFIPGTEIRGQHAFKLFQQFLLGEHRIELNGKKLGDPGQVFTIRHR